MINVYMCCTAVVQIISLAFIKSVAFIPMITITDDVAVNIHSVSALINTWYLSVCYIDDCFN